MADRVPRSLGVLDRIAYELGVAVRKTTNAVSSGRRAVSRVAVPRRLGRRRGGRREAARARRFTGDRSLRRLAVALGADDPAERARAVQVVGELSPDIAADLLADAVHDPDPGVRRAAARAAARARANGVVFSLILGLDDPDEDVRAAMNDALAEITGKPLELGNDDAQRRDKIAELKRWWKQRRLEQLTGTPAQEDAP